MASNSTEASSFYTYFVFLFVLVQIFCVLLVCLWQLCDSREHEQSTKEKLIFLSGVACPVLCLFAWLAYDNGLIEEWAVIIGLSLFPLFVLFVLIFYRNYYSVHVWKYVFTWILLIAIVVTEILALIDESKPLTNVNVALTFFTYVVIVQTSSRTDRSKGSNSNSDAVESSISADGSEGSNSNSDAVESSISADGSEGSNSGGDAVKSNRNAVLLRFQV